MPLPAIPTVGSLVRVRERDWVVLTSAAEGLVTLRPLSGSEEETTSVLWDLEREKVDTTTFPDPDPARAGDYLAGKLLRDAARLSLRSGAGPFRSVGRVSVRPRPYQYVPLIMALRLDPVRMLIADDVGVGKTIEAALVARELLDRGDARRVCVLCPPHLCDQWQTELANKFHVHAEIVRTSTIARLERMLPPGDVSPFRYYPHLVVSVDFAKGERRRALFVRDCPDLLIVDEVHTAAKPGPQSSREQQQRHELLRELARDPNRHLLLLSATPHSGIEESFLSILGLLKPEFGRLDLRGLSESQLRTLARQFVQRRRADVSKWLGAETPFPSRVPPFEETYALTPDYSKLFKDVLAFTRETVQAPSLTHSRRRVRYWAALTLLRCLMSSPDAAVQALAAREPSSAKEKEEEGNADEELQRREALDPMAETETVDTVSDVAVEAASRGLSDSDKARLRGFRQRAEQIALSGQDLKIKKAEEITAGMLRQGFHPIVYCRFVATAKYVAAELQKRLQTKYEDLRAIAVTSETGSDEEREVVIDDLVQNSRRVLVATDCLSEGINLQDHFDAVLHYDLPWNPNRLEQREGRVDRFGQKRKEVRAVLLYSPDNTIDGIVLEVLIRKAKAIYEATGVRVPIPADSESVAQALIKAVFEDWRGQPEQMPLGFEDFNTVKQLHLTWELEAEREKESRTRFAQHAIKEEELKAELEATDSVLGDADAVRRFLLNVCDRFKSDRLKFTFEDRGRYFALEAPNWPDEIQRTLGRKRPAKVVFSSPPPQDLDNAIVLERNHPAVSFLADGVLSKAFSPKTDSEFRVVARCGATYTNAVDRRTLILLLRVRYRLSRRGMADQFAEEVLTVGLRSEGTILMRVSDPEALGLLETAAPAAPISPQEQRERIQVALEEVKAARADLQRIAQERAGELEASYERLKQQIGGKKVTASAELPDVLGLYVLLPGGKA